MYHFKIDKTKSFNVLFVCFALFMLTFLIAFPCFTITREPPVLFLSDMLLLETCLFLISALFLIAHLSFVNVYEDKIIIAGNLFFLKRVYFKNIISIGKPNDNEYIIRNHPAYSKNVLKIQTVKSPIFISIKPEEQQKFIELINERIKLNKN